MQFRSQMFGYTFSVRKIGGIAFGLESIIMESYREAIKIVSAKSSG